MPTLKSKAQQGPTEVQIELCHGIIQSLLHIVEYRNGVSYQTLLDSTVLDVIQDPFGPYICFKSPSLRPYQAPGLALAEVAPWVLQPKAGPLDWDMDHQHPCQLHLPAECEAVLFHP
jgi:hypothetical protein